MTEGFRVKQDRQGNVFDSVRVSIEDVSLK